MQRVLCGFVAGLIATSLGQGDSVAQRRPPVRPDFSGKWTLVAGPQDPHRLEWAISQDESSITFVTANRSMTYKIDGPDIPYETTTVRGDVWKRLYHARWVSNALLITTKTDSSIGRWEDAMIWSLDGGGNLQLVTVDATTSMELVMKTQLLTYRRAQGTPR